MKRLFSILTTITLLITVTTGGFTTSAQQSNTNNIPQNPFATPRAKQKEFLDRLPASLKRGATPEAKAAWEKLTSEERAKVKGKVDKLFEEAMTKASKDKEAKRAQKAQRKAWKDILKGKGDNTAHDITLLFTDKQQNRKLVQAKESESVMQMPREPCDYCDPDPCPDCYPYNQSPQVSITASPTSGTAPLAVNFTANASDPDGYITGYYWNFGDGQTASGASVSHTYQTAGNFTASVTVSDDYGNSAGASIVVSTSGTQQQGADADGDTLPESFENGLADAFTPIYHVSAYEPDQFATFVPNSLQQIVQNRYGQNPVSHFRVQPLGWGYNRYNQLVSVIRIDYLTLWDHDSGLVTGGACDAFPGLNELDGIQSHNLDNERSAVLVAAPVSSANYYNLDPNAYSAYSYYTAAHEGAPNDKSKYIDFPTNPIPAGLHIHLALSLSKHATYTFNPDYLTLVPDYVIYSVIAGVDLACYYGTFNDYDLGYSDYLCLAAMYYAYGLFYGCAVERFVDQGGRFADLRINVGEPNNPINGALFIQNDSAQSFRLYSKLVNRVF